ncbi:MAG: tetratricopeptide repeat protein, partial [Actinomycetota bacterium]|nr:tetratricopeptide repeat protein [Actinomycetota bacterium]
SLTEGLGYYDEIQTVGGQYIVDPVFLLNPAVLAAYVLGVPFLVLRVRQSAAAQLLLGTLLFVPIVCFVPPIANFAGEVIGPWILPRLAWPIPLAAVIVLGWLLWEGLTYAKRRLVESGSRTERLAGVLLAPLLVFCGLVAAAPHSIAQLETADQSGEVPEEEVSCSDPVFAWMDDGLPSSSTVLAPDEENSCIMARASTVNILSYRKQKPGRQEFKVILERFYDAATLDTDKIRTLRYYGVDYIMFPREEELGEQMRHRPNGFTEVEIPGDKYVLYEVDLPNLETDALVPANDLLLSGDFDAATTAYEETLEEAQETGDEDALFLSYLGLAQSYTGQKLPDEAAPYYEQAAALAPESEAAHLLLSRAKEAAGEAEEARAAQERAVELAPGNANLRLRLADLALKAGDEEEAIGQYRMLVEAFPEVPRYRALLGKALLLAGNGEAAEKQLREATDLSPLSEEVYVEVGAALRDAGRLEAAAARYERAVELEPKNQLYNLDLGRIYSTLSTAGGWDEAYFEKAERTLVRAAGQQPVPGSSADSQQAALLALGDLYYRWNREEEAIAVYEQVLRDDPESEAASNRLEELQG